MIVEQRASKEANVTRAGTVKSILFQLRNDDGLENRLQTALALAHSCSAHLHCLEIVPVEAFATVDALGSFVGPKALAMLEEQSAKLRIRIEGRLKSEDVAWSYETTRETLIPHMLKAAALSDLVIIGRVPQDPEFGRSGRSLLGEIICKSRTPLCIPGSSSSPIDPFGTVLIAWNGSIEAANAIRQSITLIGMASTVRLIRIAEEKERAFPDTHVLEYLSRHGVHAQLETRSLRRRASKELVEYAAAAGASYIIMGGYGHSRAGEFLFGGVTRDLIGEAQMSLIIAH